jgi:hypothetical protein
MTTPMRWQRRPDGSNWGEFGPDDQYGRLNLLTPQVVRNAIAEVREGRTFCLSLPLDYPGGNSLSPSRLPPVLRPTMRKGRPSYAYKLAAEDARMTDVLNDDLAILHLQYSTQWDALGHVGQMFDADGDGTPEMVFYNGFRAGSDIVGPQPALDERTSTVHADALGVERLAERCIQGRGVMIDLEHHVGRDRVVVDYDRLMHMLERDRIEVETGDIVCLHTGLAAMILESGRNPDGATLLRSCAVLDGRDERLLRWITDTGLVAIAADNYAVELNPGRDQKPCSSYLPLHEHCLFKLGIPLGELWYLTELATWLRASGRFRFLLTAPPLRLPGAVGSPVTPIATV